MIKKLILIYLINFVHLISFAQEIKENNPDKISFKIHPTRSDINSFKNYIKRETVLFRFRTHPKVIKLNDRNDIAEISLDTIIIKLIQGSEIDPYEEPPRSRFLFFKIIFNKIDSQDMDRINYLKLIGFYKQRNCLTSEIVEYLLYRQSYYNEQGVKSMTFNFYLKPDDKGFFKIYNQELVN